MNRTESRRRWLGVAVVFGVLAVTASGCVDESMRREGPPFHWDEKLAAGSVLSVRGINGRIEVGPAAGDEAVVDAEKLTRGGDPDQVKIEVTQEGDRTVIRARHRNAWFALGDDDVVVNFKVRVPAGVDLRLVMINGSIEAESLSNRVEARTVNGGVTIDTRDEAEARSVNGSIMVRAVPRSGELSFKTINGSVRLEFPAEASARLRARTINGAITSEFPITRFRERIIGRSLRGTVGDGDAEVQVHTINGSIAFAKAG